MLFLPGLSGSGKCQNKIAGLSRFSRPFRALSDKMSIMKLVNFSPFLESFFPGGGGKVTKIPNWYSNGIFRLSVSKTKRDSIGGVKKWGKLGSGCDSTQTSRVFRSAATRSIANCVNTQAKSCQVVVSNFGHILFFFSSFTSYSSSFFLPFFFANFR